ncbi:MAG: hypothetical protein JO053_00665 [Acidobacteria bacterium]|nr:hypothetical protein [Acidobacteriota bacterium]
MLHCFNCGSDLPDDIVFCLQCGVRLDDETVTVVHRASKPEPIRPIGSGSPSARPGSGIGKLVVGGLLGAAAVVVLFAVLGVVLYSMMGPGNQNIAVNNKTLTQTPAPLTPTPAPKPKTPTPTPGENLLSDDDTDCEIVNPQGGDVNLRRDCDTKDCSQDPSTIYTKVEAGEYVTPTGKPRVTTGKFTWVQVKYKGETLWVSSTRLDCL